MNDGKFKKGNIPWHTGTKGIKKSWNKGTKGIMKPNSGSFQKGERRSVKTEFKKDRLPMNFIGRYKDGVGYIKIYMPEHPFASSRKTVNEHRLTMEKHIGRYLEPKEVVHHINGIKDDNRIENLQLLPHQGVHLLLQHPRQKPYNTQNQRMCNICKEIKQLTDKNFYKNKRLRFGFSYTCKKCDNNRCRPSVTSG